MPETSGRPKLRKAATIALLLGIGFGGWGIFRPKPEPKIVQPLTRQITALGRLTPEGGLVPLAIPSGSSGNEVVEQWFAKEGEAIREGQVLARLSNFPELNSSVKQAESNLKSTKALLPFLEVSESRGRELFKGGAISEEELAKTTAKIIEKRADIQAARAELTKAQSQLNTGQVRSPINGKLIRIYSFPGMKATDEGIALIGRTDKMQVWAQVFQTDISKLKPGQSATITAETGGFNGTLKANLNSIIGQVSDRDLFSISSNNDVNARVVLVKLDLQDSSQYDITSLSGLNVTVRFDS